MFNLNNRFVGISNKIKLSIEVFLILLIFVYFVFHAVSGRNGMRSYFEIKRLTIEQQREFERLRTEKEQLERRVSLLGKKSIDLDLLEERCRSILNYAFPDDVIIDENSIL